MQLPPHARHWKQLAARRAGTPGCRRLLTGALSLFAAALLPLAWTGGCSMQQSMDPQTPEGALAALVDAYSKKDEAFVYEHLSARTHQQVHESYEKMKQLRDRIQKDFPLGPREKALQESGVGILEGVLDEQDFFARLMRLDGLAVEAGEVYGATVVSAELDEEKGVAVLTTEANQKYRMVRNDKGVWKSAHLEPMLEERLAVLRQNLEKVGEFHARVVKRDEEVQALLKGGSGDAEQASEGGGSAGDGDEASAAVADADDKKKKKKKKRKKRRKRRRRR